MRLINPRKYGRSPYNIAILHGGPGAPGEMTPVAEELSSLCGILEPFQTKDSINGQIKELKSLLDRNSKLPAILIGWSWGAWLGFIFSSIYPKYVKKLILVSSGPFEEKYAEDIMKTRLIHLKDDDKEKLYNLMESLDNPLNKNKENLMESLGKLISKSDSYRPITNEGHTLDFQQDIYQKVWKEASELRKCGKLLDYSKNISCPVVAIHGDHDPYPYEGVKKPLSKALKDFRFILLKKCGHSPWNEKLAKDKFYKFLKKEIE